MTIDFSIAKYVDGISILVTIPNITNNIIILEVINIFGFDKNDKKPLTDIWPKGDNGENEKAVFLCHLSASDMQDELLVSMLDAYGIPVIKNYPGDGEFGRVILGMSGLGTDLYVPESMLEDALNLMNNTEEVTDEQLP